MSIHVTSYSVVVGESQQLEQAQREDREFRLTFTDGDTPVDLTGAQAIVLTVRSRSNGILAFARNYSGFQGTAEDGTPKFQVLQADMAGLSVGPWDVDVSWTDASGYTQQLLVASTFETLLGVGQASDPLTTPPAVPVTYGLNWWPSGYPGFWSSISGGYRTNDAIMAYDGSLGATAISTFRALLNGATLYPLGAGGSLATGWAYIGQHGGAVGTGSGGGMGGGFTDVPIKATGYSMSVGEYVRGGPTSADVPFYLPTTIGDITIKNVASGIYAIAVTPVGVDTIDGATGPVYLTAWEVATFHKASGYNDWLVS